MLIEVAVYTSVKNELGILDLDVPFAEVVFVSLTSSIYANLWGIGHHNKVSCHITNLQQEVKSQVQCASQPYRLPSTKFKRVKLNTSDTV